MASQTRSVSMTTFYSGHDGQFQPLRLASSPHPNTPKSENKRFHHTSLPQDTDPLIVTFDTASEFIAVIAAPQPERVLGIFSVLDHHLYGNLAVTIA